MICQMIAAAAAKYVISASLLTAVIHQESNFNPKAVNDSAPVHSFGLGQLTYATARHHCKLDKTYIYDIHKNLDCSAKVLAWQFKRYKGDVNKTLSAYNAGTFTLKNRDYVDLVRGRLKENYCKLPEEFL